MPGSLGRYPAALGEGRGGARSGGRGIPSGGRDKRRASAGPARGRAARRCARGVTVSMSGATCRRDGRCRAIPRASRPPRDSPATMAWARPPWDSARSASRKEAQKPTTSSKEERSWACKVKKRSLKVLLRSANWGVARTELVRRVRQAIQLMVIGSYQSKMFRRDQEATKEPFDHRSHFFCKTRRHPTIQFVESSEHSRKLQCP